MTFLPIVDRELRVRARWRSTYVVRTGVAVLALAVTMVMSMGLIFGTAAIGRTMLLTLGWIAFAFCVVEGFRSTADCLSEEKREGTLGLLFLTDLRGYDVVLGKFVAASLSSVYGLLAALPALAVPVLLGGVTGVEFWRVVLALLITLWLSLTAGILVSTVSRSERKSWATAAILVLTVVILFPAADAALNITALRLVSPTTGMIAAFEPYYSAKPGFFWWPVLASVSAGAILLFVSALLLPRSWQDRSQPQRVRTAPRSPASRERRKALLNINPVWWLTSRDHAQRRWLWALVGTAVVAGAGVWLWDPGDTTGAQIAFVIAIVTHLILNLWVAVEACYSFSDARSSGAMELLLSTPLPVKQIVRGQQLAITDFFRRPMVALVIAELTVLGFQATFFAVSDEPVVAVFSVIGVSLTIGCLVLDLFALSRVGMWFSLTSSKPTVALAKTILYVLVLPLALVPCCTPIAPGLMLAKSFIFLTWAQGKLDRDFRTAATRRFEPARESWWNKRQPPPLRFPGG